MTENLKRCPFCGGEAKCIEYYGLYHVVCCDCYTTGRDCPSIETACKAWNSRPIENELTERIWKLESENKRLREALGKIIGETKDYERRLPGPSFVVIRIYAEKALKGDKE